VSEFYLPYLIDYNHLLVEKVAIFAVAVLTAILVSAEGQGFAATLFGDARVAPKERFHFNVFSHMSLLGTLCFFVAGFGWAKEVKIDIQNFKNKPGLRLIGSRLGGPIANLLLASIGASLAWLLGNWGFRDDVFPTIVAVNVTMAVYSLLPISPLPGSALVMAMLPEDRYAAWQSMFQRIGPYMIIIGFGLIRIADWHGVANVINPLVEKIMILLLAP
jgi:hypothetical protein